MARIGIVKKGNGWIAVAGGKIGKFFEGPSFKEWRGLSEYAHTGWRTRRPTGPRGARPRAERGGELVFFKKKIGVVLGARPGWPHVSYSWAQNR